MRVFIVLSLLAVTLGHCRSPKHVTSPLKVVNKPVIPDRLLGRFVDDYGIAYTIMDSIWIQQPGITYHILDWNTGEKFIIARNDKKNPSEPDLYTRIDYTYFEGMEPYGWGFCLTVYNALSDSAAAASPAADRANPRKGCNGFPFSRMKRAGQ